MKVSHTVVAKVCTTSENIALYFTLKDFLFLMILKYADDFFELNMFLNILWVQLWQQHLSHYSIS